MKTAAAWKAYYAAERAALGPRIDALFDEAPQLALPEHGALIFPHTRLAVTGGMVAAVARAVVASGADCVLALGVLHGARERDAELVAAARAGDGGAVAALRRVHVDGEGHASEEFSLDSLRVLVERAAALAGRRAPRIVARYPFLVGEDPSSLPGIDELRELGPIVATTDPIHHGIGYGAPPDRARDARGPPTLSFARTAIDEQLAALAQRDWSLFQRLTAEHRSDFRDVGPVLATLLGPHTSHIEVLQLVDYAEALGVAPPTWVAGALVTARTAR